MTEGYLASFIAENIRAIHEHSHLRVVEGSRGHTIDAHARSAVQTIISERKAFMAEVQCTRHLLGWREDAVPVIWRAELTKMPVHCFDGDMLSSQFQSLE